MKFLVAVDGSSSSESALTHVLDVASASGASVALVHDVDSDVRATGVSEPPADVTGVSDHLVVESETDAERRGDRLLDEAVATAKDRDVDAERVVPSTPLRAASTSCSPDTGRSPNARSGSSGASPRRSWDRRPCP